jgi:hypothetical protein
MLVVVGSASMHLEPPWRCGRSRSRFAFHATTIPRPLSTTRPASLRRNTTHATRSPPPIQSRRGSHGLLPQQRIGNATGRSPKYGVVPSHPGSNLSCYRTTGHPCLSIPSNSDGARFAYLERSRPRTCAPRGSRGCAAEVRRSPRITYRSSVRSRGTVDRLRRASHSRYSRGRLAQTPIGHPSDTHRTVSGRCRDGLFRPIGQVYSRSGG